MQQGAANGRAGMGNGWEGLPNMEIREVGEKAAGFTHQIFSKCKLVSVSVPSA